MAPKRGHKTNAKLGGTRQSPALSMMLESSPDRAELPQKRARANVPAGSGIKSVSFANDGHTIPKNHSHSIMQISVSDAKGKAKELVTVPDQLWCDSYAPVERCDLAIHKKKIEQVEGWLRDSLDGSAVMQRHRRILAISGPAGCGKSSLIRILSKPENLNFEIVEWKTEEVHRLSPSNGGSTLLDQFGLFLSSASRYNTLSMEMDDEDGTSRPAAAAVLKPASITSSRKVIVLEDLPNVNHASTRASFNAALDAFLNQSGDFNTPLVLIISENIPRSEEWGAEGSSGTYKDRNDATLTVRSLIPSHVTRNSGFVNLVFNPVAPTFLTKALKRVLELARSSLSTSIPAPTSESAKDLIEVVVESASGDLRSAINTLQVICLRGESLLQERGVKRKAGGKSSKNKKGAKKTTRSAVASISGRESSLLLFHTLGKILYNKRVGDRSGEGESDSEGEAVEHKEGLQREEAELPPHLALQYRRESKVDVEMLWRSMTVDQGTLQAFLHQNYTAFCNDVEQCAAFSENVSLSASLKPAHEEYNQTPLVDYYSFLISVCGALLSLPSPIPRNQNRKFKGNLLFQNMKELRENAEKINDFQTSQREDYQGRLDSLVMSTLSEASTVMLLCEVLPLVSKTDPRSVPKAVRELVEMPWKVQDALQGLDVSEEELDSMAQDFTGMEEEVRVLDMSKSVTKPIVAGKVASLQAAKGTFDDDAAEEEDDEIEESD
ncbi:hypothetical protein CBS101457_004285 [Exobasidium rhododendri]|nr:hypothetical protein CBS101457_004285 [Exobasidium rhododendri]